MNEDLKAGDLVRIPHVTPGHDRHKATDVFKVKSVHHGDRLPTALLEGSPSLWPLTRLRKISK